MQKAQTSS